MRRLAIAGAIFGLVALACSVSFNPTGQPCAPDGGCLTTPIRYVCQDHVCVEASGGTASGTTGHGSASSSSGKASSSATSSGAASGSSSNGSSGSGGSSSGALGCEPACLADEVCFQQAHACEPRTCANLLCPVLEICVSADAGAQCVPRASSDAGPTNAVCATDADCKTSGYFCLHALHAVAGIPSGLCTKECQSSTECSGADACNVTLPTGRGGLSGLCLDVSAPATCPTSTTCANLGLACSLFDDPGQADLPIAFCDASDAGPPGHSCRAPTDCQSGLCAGPPDAGVCYAACQGIGTCPTGETCDLVTPRGASGNAYACVAAATTRCTRCTTSATCGVDAPVCDPVSGSCNLACAAGEELPCGASSLCGAMGVCDFDGGTCH